MGGGGGDGNRSNWTMHYISCYWCCYYMLITFFLVILSFLFGLNVARILALLVCVPRCPKRVLHIEFYTDTVEQSDKTERSDYGTKRPSVLWSCHTSANIQSKSDRNLHYSDQNLVIYTVYKECTYHPQLSSMILKKKAKKQKCAFVKKVIVCSRIKMFTNKTLRSVHFGVVVVELINCKCGGIVRNQIW